MNPGTTATASDSHGHLACLVVALMLSWGYHPAKASWETEKDHINVSRSRNMFEVGRSRIFEVSTKNLERAIRMLQTREVVRLSLEEAEELTGQKISPEECLDVEEDGFLSKIRERKEELRDPFFRPQRECFSEEIKELAVKVKHCKKIRGRLKPYLVRGLICPKAYYQFFMANFNGTDLWIVRAHSKFESEPLFQQYPAILLLENQPIRVHVGHGVAMSR
jgi:hypothetical protein